MFHSGTKQSVCPLLQSLIVISLLNISSFAFATDPATGSINPAAGSTVQNATQAFSCTYSDSDGWQDIKEAHFLLNTGSSTQANSAYCYYNQNTNLLYLSDDAGTTWLGGYTPGTSQVMENSSVKIYCASTTVSGSGDVMTVAWSVSFKAAFAGSKNAYLYVIDDADGTQGFTQAGTWTIINDITPPQITFSGVTDGSFVNADVTPVVAVTDDQSVASQTITLNGSAFESGTAISAEGTYTLGVQASDTAGNNGQESVTFTIDKTPPQIPVITSPAAGVFLNLADDTDQNQAGFQTSITGTAEADSIVTVKDAGATNLGSGTAATGNGTFSITVTLPEGTTAFTAVSADTAGNISSTAPVTVKVDTLAPSAPVITSPTNQFSTNLRTVTVSGTDATDAKTVDIYVNDTAATSIVSGAGVWTVADVALSEGENSIKARARDEAGNAGTFSPAVSVTVNTSPLPTLSLVNFLDNESKDDCFSPNGDGFQDTGILQFVQNLPGTAEVIVDTDQNGTFDPTSDLAASIPITVGKTGRFEWEGKGRDGTPVADGAYRMRVTATAADGRIGPCAVTLAYKDTTAPVITMSSPVSGALQAGADNDANTAGFQATIAGRCDDPGAQITVVVNGNKVSENALANDGSFTHDNALLQHGQNLISVTATDKDGNANTLNTEITVAGGMISGSVKDSLTKNGIFGAIVSLNGSTFYADDKGSFTVPHVLPGTYAFDVDFAGYKQLHGSAEFFDGINQLPVELEQMKFGKISGNLTFSPSSTPAVGAALLFTSDDDQSLTSTVYSDSTGNYVTPALPVGSYSLSVTYPASNGYSGQVTIVEGVTPLNVSLTRTEFTGTATGTVKDRLTTNAIGGAEIHVGNATATSAADGSFTVSNIQLGNQDHACLSFQVSSEGYQTYAAAVEIEAGSNPLGDALLTPVQQPGTETEPNNAIGQAQGISIGISASGTIGTAYDGDFFKIHVDNPGLLTVSMTNVAQELRGQICVFNASETEIGNYANYSYGADTAYGFPLPAAGDYYFELKSVSGEYSTSPYTVTTAFTPSIDASESNDDIEHAVSRQAGSTMQGTIFPANDLDFNKLHVDHPGSLTVSMTNVPQTVRGQICVLNSSGTEIGNYANYSYGADVAYGFQLPAAGDYYVELKAVSAEYSTSQYTMTTAFAPSIDASEPNDDIEHAVSRQAESTSQGAIFPANDLDFSKIHVDYAGPLTVSMTNVPQTVRGQICVLNASGTEIGNYANYSYGADVAYGFQLPAAGDYYVELKAAGGECSTSPYTVTTAFAPSIDASEPNDDMEHAAIRQAGSTMQGTIFPANDLDFSKIHVDHPGPLTVSMTNVPQAVRGQIYVLNASGTEIGNYANYSYGADVAYGFPLPAAGDYYIELKAVSGEYSTSPYTMITEFTPSIDASEPNDDIEHAVSRPTESTVQGTIFPAYDADFSKIHIDHPGPLTVSMTNVPQAVRGQICIFNSSGTEIGNYPNYSYGSDVTYGCQLPAAGDYYIELKAVSGEYSASPYTMTTTFAPSIDASEPNDDIEHAVSRQAESTVQGTIFPGNDLDFSKIHVDNPGSLTVSMTNVAPELRGQICVLNASGTEIGNYANYSYGANTAYGFQLPTAGDYYVELKAVGGEYSTSQYTMTTTFTPSIDASEPDNDMEHAASRQAGSTVQGTIFPGNDLDFSKIHVDNPGLLTVSMTNMPPELRGQICVLNNSGTEIGSYSSASYGADVAYWFQLTGAGDYFIELKAVGGEYSTSPYTLTTAYITSIDLFEPNNDYTSATALTLNSEIQADIFGSSDVDYYSIHLDTQSNLSVYLTRAASGLVPKISIYDAGYQLISSILGPAGTGCAVTAALSAGDYFVLVENYQHGSEVYPYSLKAMLNDLWLNSVYDSADPFSPNADDVLDTTVINAAFSQEVSWNISIRDAQNSEVRAFSGQGSTVAQTWDGKNSSNSLVPDGTYYYFLSATSGNSTIPVVRGCVTVDTTPPELSISSPQENQSVAGDFVIEGSAQDVNFSSYGLEFVNQTENIGSIAYPTTQVQNGVLGTWNTRNAANGAYTLNLISTDTAGNNAVCSRHVMIDNLNISNVLLPQSSFRPADGENLLINYVLDDPASIKCTIYDIRTSNVVRTMTNQRILGANTEVWDGKDDSGKIVPPGGYEFTLDADDGRGWHQWPEAPTDNPLSDFQISESFNPFAGENCFIRFTASHPCQLFIRTQFGDTQYSLPYIFSDFVGKGQTTVYWDGRDENGKILDYCTSALPLKFRHEIHFIHNEVIIVKPSQISPISVSADPYAIVPAYGDISTITYAVQSTGTVTINVVKPGTTTVIKTLLPATVCGPGRYSLLWDGKTDAGALVSEADDYVVQAQLTEASGAITTSKCNLTVDLVPRTSNE